MIRLIPLILILAFGQQLYSQGDARWETIIRMGDFCKYYIPDRVIGTDWRNKDFDDSEWVLGQTGFGRDDGDDNTILPGDGAIAIYLRFVLFD